MDDLTANADLTARLAVLRAALARTPHALGDHTDLCRHQNSGVPPRDPALCHCHVAAVAQALADPQPQAAALLRIAQAARAARDLLAAGQAPEALQRLEAALAPLDGSH